MVPARDNVAHYCPDVAGFDSPKGAIENELRVVLFGLDLKRFLSIGDPARSSIAGGIDESWEAGVRASHTTLATDNVSTVRGPARWRARGQELFLPRSIPVHDVRAARWPMPTKCATGVSMPTLRRL